MVWIVSGLLLGGAILNKLTEPIVTKGEENDDKER